MGGSGTSRVVSTTPPLDAGLGGPSSDSTFGYHSVFSDKLEDGFSVSDSQCIFKLIIFILADFSVGLSFLLFPEEQNIAL